MKCTLESRTGLKDSRMDGYGNGGVKWFQGPLLTVLRRANSAVGEPSLNVMGAQSVGKATRVDKRVAHAARIQLAKQRP